MVYLKYNTPFTRILNDSEDGLAKDESVCFSSWKRQPHIYIYTLKYYLIHVSARSDGIEIYNCDNKYTPQNN